MKMCITVHQDWFPSQSQHKHIAISVHTRTPPWGDCHPHQSTDDKKFKLEPKVLKKHSGPRHTQKKTPGPPLQKLLQLKWPLFPLFTAALYLILLILVLSPAFFHKNITWRPAGFQQTLSNKISNYFSDLKKKKNLYQNQTCARPKTLMHCHFWPVLICLWHYCFFYLNFFFFIYLWIWKILYVF